MNNRHKPLKINIYHNRNIKSHVNDAKLLYDNLSFNFLSQNILLDAKILDLQDSVQSYVDINIFMYKVNTLFTPFSKINVLFVEHSLINKSVSDDIKSCDYIFTKSKYTYDIFSQLLGNKKRIFNIGWSIHDIRNNKFNRRNQNAIVHISGDNKNNGTQRLIDSWTNDLPLLKIFYPDENNIQIKNQENIEYFCGYLNDEDYQEIIHTYKIHISLPETPYFNRYLSEVTCCGGIVITLETYNEQFSINGINNLVKVSNKGKKKTSKIFGNLIGFKHESLRDVVKSIYNIHEKDFKNLEKQSRIQFLEHKKSVKKKICSALNVLVYELDEGMNYNFDETDINSKPIKADYALKQSDIDNNELPNIAILTVIKDREYDFKLLCENIKVTTYPKNKITWYIVDNIDRNQRSKHYDMKTLSEIKFKHNVFDKKGDKQKCEGYNWGIKMIKEDIVLHYEPGYYYSAPNIMYRVRYLLGSSKDTSIKCLVSMDQINYNYITNQISIMYPNLEKPYYERIISSTLTYYKDYGIINRFIEHEGSFIKGNYDNFCVMPSLNLLLKISEKHYNTCNYTLDKTMINTIHKVYDGKKIR